MHALDYYSLYMLFTFLITPVVLLVLTTFYSFPVKTYIGNEIYVEKWSEGYNFGQQVHQCPTANG